MHVQKTWDGIMNAPVSLDEHRAGRDAVGRLQALFTTTAILGRDAGAVHQPQPEAAGGAGRAGGLVGIMFASIALIFNALARATTSSPTTSRWCSRR